MKRQLLSLILLLLVLLAAVQPALAQEVDEVEGVFLPGWFAWLMVILAIGIPLVLLIYLRRNGQL